MQVIIVDMTGSISKEQAEAGTLFANQLMSSIDKWKEPTCLLYYGNFDGDKPVYLERIVAGLRAANDCVVHLITDGFLTQSELDAVDRVYLYDDRPDSENYLKDKVCQLVLVDNRN
jgi:hypothetical protein